MLHGDFRCGRAVFQYPTVRSLQVSVKKTRLQLVGRVYLVHTTQQRSSQKTGFPFILLLTLLRAQARTMRHVALLLLPLLSASGASGVGVPTAGLPPPHPWTGVTLGLLELWKDAWVTGAAQASALAVDESPRPPPVKEERGENKTAPPPPGDALSSAEDRALLLDDVVGINETRRFPCVVNVTKLNLDAAAFEGSCPGQEKEGYFPEFTCGATCGCELGRRLELAGYPVLGPDAINTQARRMILSATVIPLTPAPAFSVTCQKYSFPGFIGICERRRFTLLFCVLSFSRFLLLLNLSYLVLQESEKVGKRGFNHICEIILGNVQARKKTLQKAMARKREKSREIYSYREKKERDEDKRERTHTRRILSAHLTHRRRPIRLFT